MDRPTQAEPVNTAPERLGKLIDECIKGAPEAAIIVAQLIKSSNDNTAERVEAFDAAVPGIVEQRAKAGHHVMVWDMRHLSPDEYNDGLHPNLFGYKQMANDWFDAMKAADKKGWIKAPIGPDPSVCYGDGGLTACSKGQKRRCMGPPVWYNPVPGNVDGGYIASGVGHGGDGKFHDAWIETTSHATGPNLNGTGVRFVSASQRDGGSSSTDIFRLTLMEMAARTTYGSMRPQEL